MHHFFAFLVLTFSISASTALAETCLPLDFDSYFIAQNAKNNLKKANEFGQPNFATHYLLLKNEMMMENIYLIADCRTGKFLHEKISGKNAVFGLQSGEVSVQPDKSETTEKFLWNGEHFMKIENPAPLVAKEAPVSHPSHMVTSSSATPSLTDAYQAVFQHYASTESSSSDCHPLVYDSHFLAQQNRKSIEKQSANYIRPNFAGNWILVKIESLFDTESLLASCRTGKFIHATLKGNPVFQNDSRLIRIDHSGSFPALYLFNEDEFIQIPDPVQNKSQEISNVLSVSDSAVLYRSLPNPEHRSLIRFEKLKKTEPSQSVFQHLQVEMISSGSCSTERGSPRCEVKTQ